MTQVIEALPTIWDWTWRTSLYVCVLICVISVFQIIFRKTLTPRWHYALWMLVLVRMIMPIGIEAPWSVYDLFKTDPPVETQTLTPLPAYDWVFETMSQPIYIPPTQPEFDLGLALSLAWLIGIALLAIHLLRQWTRLRKLVAAGNEIKSREVLGLMHTSARDLRIRKAPPIIECAIPVPGLYGFLRPTLLMPQGLLETLTKDEIRFILLHELAHYKRRDLPVNWLMTLLQIFHWFNPLVWYAFMRMRTDRELACDALVLSRAKADDPEAYGKTLFKLMDQNHGIRPIPGMIGILENHAHLKRRIISIARFTTKSYKWSIPALLILALVGGVTLTQAVQEEKPANQDDSDLEEASKDVESDDGDSSNETSSDASLRGELKRTREFRMAGRDDGTVSGLIRIYGGTISADRKNFRFADVLRSALESGSEIEIETLHVRNLKQIIEDSYKKPVEFDDDIVAPNRSHPGKQYHTEGVIKSRTIKHVNLKKMLNLLLAEVDLALVEYQDKIHITSPEKAAAVPQAMQVAQAEEIGKNSQLESIAIGLPVLTNKSGTARWVLVNIVGGPPIPEPFDNSERPKYRAYNKDLSASEDPLRKRINIDLKNADLANVIALLTKKGNIQTIIQVPLNAKVTASLKDIPLGRALEVILKMNGLGIVQEQSAFTISADDGPSSRPGASRNNEAPQVTDAILEDVVATYTGPYLANRDLPEDEDPLRKKINVDFKDSDLASAISTLAQKAQIDVIASVDLGGKVTLDRRDIIIGRAIEMILRTHDLGIVEETGIYRITTYNESYEIRQKQATGIRRRGFNLYNPDVPEDDDPLRELVNIDFKDMELNNVIELLAKKGKIDFIYDTEVSGNVIANLSNIPLGRAIEVVLRMNDLGIIKEGDHYRITTYEKAVASRSDTEMVFLKNTEAAAVKKTLDEILAQTGEGRERVRIGINTQRNIIVLSGPKNQVEELTNIIDDLDAQKPEHRDQDESTSEQEVQNVRIGGQIRIRSNPVDPSEALSEKLQQSVSFVYENIHLATLAKGLEENYAITIYIDYQVVQPLGPAPPKASSPLPFTSTDYVTDGHIDYLNLKGVTLQQALQAITKPFSLAPYISGDIITITTPEKIRVASFQALKLKRDQDQVTKIEELLEIRKSGNLIATHLKDIIEFISDHMGINIMVDNRVVGPIKGSTPTDLQAPTEYVTDGIINRELIYDDETVKNILDDILQPLGLAYSIQKGFIWISSPEKLRTESFENLITLYYALPESTEKRLQLATANSDDELSILAHPPRDWDISQSDWEKINWLEKRIRSIMPLVKEPVTKKSFPSLFTMRARTS